MPGFDALAPDQKAVLQLLLKQGKSYDDIAGLLRLDRENVRERALDALDALGQDGAEGLEAADELSPERQDEVADHLLLQQTASERAATRQFLETSAPARTWARGVAAELGPIAGDALPDIPAEPAEVAEAFDALDERTAARERQEKSSKLGGVLILAAVGALVALGLLVLVRSLSGLSGDDEPAPRAEKPPPPACVESAAGATGATGTTGAGTLPQQQINLEPLVGSDSKALAVAIIADDGLAFQAEKLPRSDLYKVWLWNSAQEAIPLGFAKYDPKTKRLAGEVPRLPDGAANCSSLVITRERSRQSPTPGPIVLGGPINKPQ
ncbi:MAG: hypothetical protein M3417_09785 [Actinomycetota bacterium]|nr:hypothetical protein [Actinomycetota bacterium]